VKDPLRDASCSDLEGWKWEKSERGSYAEPRGEGFFRFSIINTKRDFSNLTLSGEIDMARPLMVKQKRNAMLTSSCAATICTLTLVILEIEYDPLALDFQAQSNFLGCFGGTMETPYNSVIPVDKA
jgi:hypothetical protein